MRGTDVVKAVALGASAVGLGRLPCLGLAAAGGAGAGSPSIRRAKTASIRGRERGGRWRDWGLRIVNFPVSAGPTRNLGIRGVHGTGGSDRSHPPIRADLGDRDGVTLLVTVGFALWFVGLIVTVPVIGHATWHAYRELVE